MNECCGKCKSENLIGKKFGRLVVIAFDEERTSDRRYKWICKCDCGNIKSVSGRSLKNGYTKSCGCITRRSYDAKSRLYHIWIGMRSRCNSPKSDAYKNYGGRGIRVCDEWNNDFEIFQRWAIENGYASDLTIDRIDVDGDYEPLNCRWITRDEQAKNKRNNNSICIDGDERIIADWERIIGGSQGVIYHRLKSGWTEEKAIGTKVRKTKRRIRCVETGKEYESIKEASILTGACASSISSVLTEKLHKAGGYKWEAIE